MQTLAEVARARQTKNWLVLFIWPFEASIERVSHTIVGTSRRNRSRLPPFLQMKKGGHHWAWSYERPTGFIVAPRSDKPAHSDWKKGETRWVIPNSDEIVLTQSFYT